MKASSHWFGRFAKWAAHYSGHPITFALAAAMIVGWLVTGPIFNYSDTWQLIINTTTTIITFLMVFLIQHTQNRDTAAMQAKLDELIRASQGAHNALLDLEELEESEIETIRKDYQKLAAEARDELTRGIADTDCREIERPAEKVENAAEDLKR